MVDLDTLLSTSRFIVLACPLTSETFHLIDAGRLALVRADSYLINVARGPVVLESDLIDALKAERLRGAALDVFETEPVDVGDHPLLRMHNVICMPHMGYVNWQEYETLFREAFASIADFFAGQPKNITNPEVLAC